MCSTMCDSVSQSRVSQSGTSVDKTHYDDRGLDSPFQRSTKTLGVFSLAKQRKCGLGNGGTGTVETKGQCQHDNKWVQAQLCSRSSKTLGQEQWE